MNALKGKYCDNDPSFRIILIKSKIIKKIIIKYKNNKKINFIFSNFRKMFDALFNFDIFRNIVLIIFTPTINIKFRKNRTNSFMRLYRL